jgi:hypothetical protein
MPQQIHKEPRLRAQMEYRPQRQNQQLQPNPPTVPHERYMPKTDPTITQMRSSCDQSTPHHSTIPTNSAVIRPVGQVVNRMPLPRGPDGFRIQPQRSNLIATESISLQRQTFGARTPESQLPFTELLPSSTNSSLYQPQTSVAHANSDAIAITTKGHSLVGKEMHLPQSTVESSLPPQNDQARTKFQSVASPHNTPVDRGLLDGTIPVSQSRLTASRSVSNLGGPANHSMPLDNRQLQVLHGESRGPEARKQRSAADLLQPSQQHSSFMFEELLKQQTRVGTSAQSLPEHYVQSQAKQQPRAGEKPQSSVQRSNRQKARNNGIKTVERAQDTWPIDYRERSKQQNTSAANMNRIATEQSHLFKHQPSLEMQQQRQEERYAREQARNRGEHLTQNNLMKAQHKLLEKKRYKSPKQHDKHNKSPRVQHRQPAKPKHQAKHGSVEQRKQESKTKKHGNRKPASHSRSDTTSSDTTSSGSGEDFSSEEERHCSSEEEELHIQSIHEDDSVYQDSSEEHGPPPMQSLATDITINNPEEYYNFDNNQSDLWNEYEMSNLSNSQQASYEEFHHPSSDMGYNTQGEYISFNDDNSPYGNLTNDATHYQPEYSSGGYEDTRTCVNDQNSFQDSQPSQNLTGYSPGHRNSYQNGGSRDEEDEEDEESQDDEDTESSCWGACFTSLWCIFCCCGGDSDSDDESDDGGGDKSDDESDDESDHASEAGDRNG